MKNVSQNEWISLIENDEKAVIIDSRAPKEWQEGIQEHAILMNVLQQDTFTQEAQELDKAKNYYVYCRSGKRSVAACTILEQNGIYSTYNLLGGMLAWEGKTVIPTL